MNISSNSIAIPFNEEQTPNTTHISPLRGEPGVYSPKREFLIENPNDSSKNQFALYQNPIRYAIIGGEENDIDNNVSNVDSTDDIGTELGFSNAQGTTVDNQFMQVQEASREPPAVSIDSISTFSGISNSFIINHTVSGTNRLLIIYIQSDRGFDVIDVSFGGNPLELVIKNESFQGPPNGPSIEVWMLKDPQIGFSNGSVSLEASDNVAIEVISYTGVDQDNPISGARSIMGIGKTLSISITSKIGDLAQDAMISSSTDLPTEGINQTRRWRVEMGIVDRWSGGSTKQGASSVSFGWTIPVSKEWIHVAFSIQSAKTPYELDLEYQWTSAEYLRKFEEVAIYTGNLDPENLGVDIWDGGSTWDTLTTSLSPNTWNNFSVTDYLTSSTLTIRFKGGTEIGDFIQDQWEIDLILLVISAENVAPRVENLTLSPDPLMSSETLILDYDFTDPDNDSESGTEIRWYKNSILQVNLNNSKYIQPGNTSKHEIWFSTVKPSDGILFGNLSTSSNITIQNTPPIVTSPSILPNNPKTGNDLINSYSWTDSDIGDIESNSLVQWYRDNGTGFILQTLFTNQSLIPSNATRKNDQWKYNITPSDGEGYGNPIESLVVTIENTPPVLIVTINNHSSPETVNDNQDLVGNYSYFDADNQDTPAIDVVNESLLNIRWLKYNSSSGLFEIAFLDIVTIDNSFTTSGDLWRCEMNISDGYDYSNYYTSPTISVDQAPNDPPSALMINLTQSNAKAGG
ncbi:MAG: hypothetical protein ACW96X_12600, partial [Promethearchaeota archaeon]